VVGGGKLAREMIEKLMGKLMKDLEEWMKDLLRC
jgi:hypothetical protein